MIESQTKLPAQEKGPATFWAKSRKVVASIAGQIGHPDIWYGITKAGMIKMTKSFARILGPKGITVNAIAPGPVETGLVHRCGQLKVNPLKKTLAYP